MPNDFRTTRLSASVPAVLAAVATVVGCRDVTSPTPAVSPVAATASVAKTDPSDAGSTEDRAALAAAVGDALTRVLPSLERSSDLSQLQAGLEGLKRSAELPGLSLSPSVARARQALERLTASAESDPGQAAELSALRLVLDRASEIDRSIPGAPLPPTN